MDIAKLKETIHRRVSLDNNDDFGIEECWKAEAEILSSDIPGAIEFLNTCTEAEFSWMAEVFDDVISITKSRELYQAMWNRYESLENSEYKEVNLVDLQYAKDALPD